MFLVGYDSYGGQVYDNRIAMETPTYVSLSSGKYDEWKLDTGIVDYTSEKTKWEYYTLFLATFNNTFEAGNMSNNGYEINEVYFKRRNKSNLMWTTFAKMKYSPTQKYYQVLDRLAQGGEEYEYCITPVTNNVEGVETIRSIVHTFEDLWIMENGDGVRLTYDIEYGDINTIGNTSIITTLENQYPYIMSTPLSYKQGTIKAKIISTSSVGDRFINVRSERDLRNRVMAFLNNKRAKLIKDGSGRVIACKIMNARETPNNVFNGELCDVSFEFVEICDYNDTRGLEEVGLMVKNY